MPLVAMKKEKIPGAKKRFADGPKANQQPSVCAVQWGHQLGNSINNLSERFRVRRTFILEVLRGNGPRFTAVASQLTKIVQKLDHDCALT